MYKRLSSFQGRINARFLLLEVHYLDWRRDELGIIWRENECLVLKRRASSDRHRVDGVSFHVHNEHIPCSRNANLSISDLQRDRWSNGLLEVRDLIEHEIQQLSVKDPVVTQRQWLGQRFDDVRTVGFVQDNYFVLQCAAYAK